MTTDLLQFPCDFSLKIIGNNTKTFQEEVIAITRRYFPEMPDDAIVSKLSHQGKYCSVQVTVHALNKAVLDALYQELTQHPDMHMVL